MYGGVPTLTTPDSPGRQCGTRADSGVACTPYSPAKVWAVPCGKIARSPSCSSTGSGSSPKVMTEEFASM
ncbi:hypothetical protein SVIOM74S_00805 [Streptomyces violarus]